MKKITLLLNGICIALAILSVFKGVKTALLFFVIYGMSLGAVLTHQKKAYYYITMVLNGLLLIVGLSLIFYDSSRVIKVLSQEFTILIALFLMFLLTPIINMVFIKTKMIVFNRRSLSKNKTISQNNTLLFEENELQENWVLLDKSESKYFTKELTSELSKKHVLYKKQYHAIARYEGGDDVLYHVKNSIHPLYVVHLTFGGKEKNPAWPMIKAFDSKSDFVKNWQQP